MAVVPYDFIKVNLIINYVGGSEYVTGFANGSKIKTARASDKYSKHTGAKGETSYAKTNDNSGTIEFTLKHDSPSNKTLSKISKGDDTISVQVVDGNDIGRMKAGGSDCVIMKPADSERGAEISERAWIINVPNLSMEDE